MTLLVSAGLTAVGPGTECRAMEASVTIDGS
jgi:hypothetical protein